MVISHNISAMFTSRQLNITERSMTDSTNKLSSGYRINRAKDDAAGLAISEKMRKQVRGLDQASENIEDGISYVQVADGALNEVHELLQRINELSVQAANGTNSASDREAIDAEVQQLKTEMERVFETTKFNEQYIWPEENIVQVPTVIGTTKVQAVQVTTPYSQSISINNNNYNLIAVNGYTIHADANGVTLEWTDYDGDDHTTKNVGWDTLKASGYSFRIGDYFDDAKLFGTDNSPLFDFQVSFAVTDVATVDDVIAAINNTKMSSSDYSYMKVTSNLSGGFRVRSPYIYYRATYASRAKADASKGETGFDFNGGNNNFLEAKSVAASGGNLNTIPTDSAPTVALAQTSGEKWSFSFEMEGIGEVKATVGSAYYSANSYDPNSAYEENLWWHWERPYYRPPYKTGSSYGISGTLGSVMDALTGAKGTSTPGLLTTTNGGDNTHNGTITMLLNLKATSSYQYGKSTDNQIGSVYMDIPVTSTDTEHQVLDKIKNALNAATKVDFDATNYTRSSSSVSHSSAYRVLVDQNVYRYDTGYEDVLMNIHAGANTRDKIYMNYKLLRLATIGLEDTNVLTEESATNAINEVEDALKIVSEQRSHFGAYQNRMEHAYNINRNTSENTQAAESQIRDTDMNTEIVRFSRLSVLKQAGESMLAQANQSKQGVLSLIA